MTAQLAADLGHDLTGAAWVAVPWEQILGHGELVPDKLISADERV